MDIIRKTEPSIFYQAEAFHISAKLLQNSSDLQGRGSPFIVNACFAIELYLKCFDGETIFNGPSESNYCSDVTEYKEVTSKVNSHGHDLLKLFKNLSEVNRKKISSIFEQQTGTGTTDDFFDKYKEHFITWRYGFEGNRTSYKSAEVLLMLDSLREISSQYIYASPPKECKNENSI